MIAILWPSRFFTARAKRDWLVLVRPGDQGAFGFGRCASHWSLVLPLAWSLSVLSVQAAGVRWSSGFCQVAATSRGVL